MMFLSEILYSFVTGMVEEILPGYLSFYVAAKGVSR